jgi:Protein of unknown function (DUF3397)
MLTKLMTAIVSLYIAVPLLVYFTIFLIIKKTTGNHKRSVRWSINISTFFFILSVHFLIFTIWGKSSLLLLLTILILMAGVFGWLFWKETGIFDYKKVFNGFWRLCFFVFFAAYIILIAYGIFNRGIQFIFS